MALTVQVQIHVTARGIRDWFRAGSATHRLQRTRLLENFEKKLSTMRMLPLVPSKAKKQRMLLLNGALDCEGSQVTVEVILTQAAQNNFYWRSHSAYCAGHLGPYADWI